MGSFLCPRSKQAELNQEEKALLDCKLCRDKIKKYIRSLEQNSKIKREEAKEALQNKNKDKAKMNLKLSKMYTEQINSANGQLEMIENQIMQIETAQSQKDAMTVLKQGNEILKKLQSEVSVEKFQEIADDMEEVKEQQNEISEFFKNHGIDEVEQDEEIDKELEQLLGTVQKEAGVELPSANIELLSREEIKEEKPMLEV